MEALNPDELAILSQIREIGPVGISRMYPPGMVDRDLLKMNLASLLERREIRFNGKTYCVCSRRLFVPLSAEPFLDFKEKRKHYEVRKCAKAFSDKWVYLGRPVELRKGYSGESLWGGIGEIYTGKLEEIFNRVPFKLVEPRANSVEEAIRGNKEILGEQEKYIAFQVFV